MNCMDEEPAPEDLPLETWLLDHPALALRMLDLAEPEGEPSESD